MAAPIAIIGTLVEVCAGPVIVVQGEQGATHLVYVQEPDRFRGHEGKKLVLDIDLGITAVETML
jgi:hypothetical protein